MMKKAKKNQLTYAQQHLANERTYLAWIRTAIAIIGIGFLTLSLHFSMGKTMTRTPNDGVAVLLGLSAGGFGMATILIATVTYLIKKKRIEQEIFVPSSLPIVFVSLALVIILLIAMLYFVIT
ncbi:hypothetical protein GCM10011391_04390 [Pullulanibacillus camelliae]|uniref:DUF202 domain-containing protein n=1 Tax=Pullulanibacillus camelliae TaxID=1707096 RepID=A0A8J2VFY0_9BACL|nr:DUF202 domain-containing protein [Pullulanibacillus camelliae]GGE28980.1 hypothetical protein GCM10011391_04390 [Pullulanibacillus camelliae]